MTFLEIKKRVARRTNKNPATVGLTDTLGIHLGDFVNEALSAVLRKPGRESLRYGTLTFPSVAGQKLYALPEHGIARINRITEATNDTKLVFKTPDWLDTVAPDPTSGTPWAWVQRGYTGVHTQPSNASAVFVDSTSASDTTPAYVEGIRSGGYFGSGSVSMTGTTAVQVGSITDFIFISKFHLIADAVGTITLHEDASGGTELSRIAIGDQRAQFIAFELYPIPSAVITYTVDVLRAIVDMTRDNDEPMLPIDFHDVLIPLTCMRVMSKSDDPMRWKAYAEEAKDGLRALDAFLTSHPDWRPTWGAPTLERAAFAGGWFPAQVE